MSKQIKMFMGVPFELVANNSYVVKGKLVVARRDLYNSPDIYGTGWISKHSKQDDTLDIIAIFTNCDMDAMIDYYVNHSNELSGYELNAGRKDKRVYRE